MEPAQDFINVLQTTPYQLKTPHCHHGFIVTGDQSGTVIFRHQHTLKPVQSFFCDGRSCHSVAHGLPPPVGHNSRAEQQPEEAAEAIIAAAALHDVADDHGDVGDAGTDGPGATDGVDPAAWRAHAGVAGIGIAENLQYMAVSVFPSSHRSSEDDTGTSAGKDGEVGTTFCRLFACSLFFCPCIQSFVGRRTPCFCPCVSSGIGGKSLIPFSFAFGSLTRGGDCTFLRCHIV